MRTSRHGAILLIVLVLLALFAVVGLTFVLFAQAEAQNARIQRDVMSSSGEVPDPQAPMNDILRQMIYGNQEGGYNVASAFRGHELARLMYGYHPTAPNAVPYSGVGTWSEPLPAGVFGSIIDRRDIINFTSTQAGQAILDPEYSWNNTRTSTQVFNATAIPNTSVFVPKNAPYTYPDRNNLAVAMLNPDTAETDGNRRAMPGGVTMPSFHRPELFMRGLPAGWLPSNDAAVNTAYNSPNAVKQLYNLSPLNPNWTNVEGRYLILRPRPFDHTFDSGDGRGSVSDFPYPPPNPDGTITGDVQNIRWSNNQQRNDSVWLHANLPVVRYRGRDVQPLVAMTILPLDGRVNFNVAGNHRDSGNGHASNQGFGAYEINPQAVLVPSASVNPNLPPNEGQQVIFYRYGSTYRPNNAPQAVAVTDTLFDPSIRDSAFADYSPVNFDAFNAPYSVPTTNTGLRTEPFYTLNQGYDNNLSSTRHQSLYNPYFLNDVSSSGGRTLRLFDLRQTAYHYSAKKSTYAAPIFGFTQADSSFTGYGPNHPSNRTRALVTTISNSVNRGGLTANFSTNTAGGNLVMLPGAPTVAPSPAISSVPTFNAATVPGANADTIPGQGYRSLAAALAPLDLNRPLADYRVNKLTPLADPSNSGGMAGQAIQADHDRQVFAKDIFDRLVVATGAACDGFDPRTGRPIGFSTVPVGSPGFDALRFLAQLAVNIVDFIDIDDISSRFVWNPVNAANPNPEQDAGNFNPATMGNSVVFGVEKTRLVLNEVYAEVTNDPSDANAQSARRPFQVRFFVELLNPLNANKNHTGPNATSTSPFGQGSANLYLNGQSVYKIKVYDNSNNVHTALYGLPAAAGNVLGTVTGTTPKCDVSMPQNATPVEPNDGQASSTGFKLVVPNESTQPDSSAYQPPNNPARVIQINAAATGTNQLQYDVQSLEPGQIANYVNNTLNQNGSGKHAVLLERLANPYMAAGPTNPYITVDTMFDIRVNDAVHVGRRPPPPPASATGQRNDPPDPNANQGRSHGRRAPLYGYRGADALASYAVDQRITPLAHNTASGKLFQTFEWLTHLDRKLIEPMELLEVASCKPHELLHYFVTSGRGQTDVNVQPDQKYHHVAAWRPSLVNPAQISNLARAFELLTVKPWMYGIPVGGRQPGRMNVNAIWHKNALSALLDKNNGNAFQTTDIDNVWNSFLRGNTASRSVSFPYVGTTADERAGGADRPIKSFGAANYATAGSLPGGSSTEDSLFRNNPSTSAPFMYINTATGAHPVQQSEMLRKAINNVTTTSDTYLAVFTIGYFEIRQPVSGTRYMPILGREVYNEIPGDLRVQYAAVIDRSMMAVSPEPQAAGTLPQQASNVFFTELTAPFNPASNATQTVTLQFRATGGTNGANIIVNYEGNSIKIRPRLASGSLAADEVSTIVVGTGSEAVAIRIPPNATIIAPTGGNGLGIISFPPGTLVSGLASNPAVTIFVPNPVNAAAPAPALNQYRQYYAGEALGSAILANPGPQAGFDPNSAAYKQVVRDLLKLTP